MTGTKLESQMCPGFLGAAPALRAPAPPTPLACTLIYLSSVGNQMLSLFLKSNELKGNWSSSRMCLSIMDQTRVWGRGPKKS